MDSHKNLVVCITEAHHCLKELEKPMLARCNHNAEIMKSKAVWNSNTSYSILGGNREKRNGPESYVW